MNWLKVIGNHVILMEYGETLSHTIIGFYITNYVLEESKGQYGITYLMDDIFYNYLWDALPNVEDIRSRTTYFYSEYLIYCKREETREILGTIEEAITFFKKIRLAEMKKLRNQYEQAHFSPKVPTLERYFEDFYYEQKRFGVSISGRTECEKWTDEQMQAWIRHSWAENSAFLCICNPPSEMTLRGFWDPANDLQPLTLSHPQRFTARGKDDICCIYSIPRDQKEIQIICALDCPPRALKLPFLVEALCYVWEGSLKKLNLEGYEVLEIPALCMDSVAPHIRFEFSILSDSLNEFLDCLIKILCRRPSSPIFQQAIAKTIERIHMFREDALEMNRMAAANYYAGSPYNMEDYICPQKALAQPYEQFLDLQTLLAKRENFSLLYAGKEKYLHDIKNALVLFNL